MKNIAISDIPVVYINLEKEKAKNQSILDFFSSHNIKNFYRIDAVQGEHIDKTLHKTQDPAYSSAIVKSFLLALSKVPAPFLLLEDDVIKTDNFTDSINMPDDADFVYLGLSLYGIKNAQSETSEEFNSFRPFKETDMPNIIKLAGMLSAHAILVATESGRVAMIKKLLSQKNMIVDVSFAQMQHEDIYKFYGIYPTLFYQSDQTPATLF